MSFENQIKEILKARLEGTATEEELAILREWLDRSPQNRELAELLEESAENLPLLGRIYGYDEQRVWGNIRKAARKRRMRMLAATARKYAAVAAVAALLAGGGWWTLGRRAERLARQAYIEQLTPGVRGAVLTLSSGENVALEAGGQRMLVEQDGTRLEIAGEGAIETTLVRGSVEVRSGHRRAMLQPGQQARVGREGAIFDVRQVAAEDYAAWTRGLFTFNDETIASICRKLSRWYGVEIVPRGVDADKVRYTGVVKRYETFAEMARLLARTDQIRADVEEGKIVLCIDRDDD